MKNKIYLVFIFSLITSLTGYSQRPVFRVDVSLGTFVMTDLKEFQSSTIPDLGVDVKSISKFPPYFGYGLSCVTYLRSGFGIGLAGDFFSTGGRNFYKDYSGSYSLDLITRAFDIGTVLCYKNNFGRHNIISFEIQQGIKLSSLDLKEKLVITETIFNDAYKLVSNSWWIRPAFRYDYSVTKALTAGFLIGGEFNLKNKLHLKNKPDAYLIDRSGEKVTINWSGLRIGLSVSINIGRKPNRQILPEV